MHSTQFYSLKIPIKKSEVSSENYFTYIKCYRRKCSVFKFPEKRARTPVIITPINIKLYQSIRAKPVSNERIGEKAANFRWRESARIAFSLFRAVHLTLFPRSAVVEEEQRNAF